MEKREAEEAERKGRILESVNIGEFTLLNNEKLGRVLDLLEGVSTPGTAEEAAVVEKCKKLEHEQAVLALYDRFGGAVKLGDRKLALGTFYDFVAREPRVKADLDESDFADEYVLVRKKTARGKKPESAKQRIKRLESKADKTEAKKDAPKAKAKKDA